MKSILSIAASLLISFSLQAQPPKVDAKSGMVFGKEFTATEAMDINMVMPTLTEVASDVMVTATVTSVCKAEGCWLKVNTTEGEVMVRMKDHAFKVPVSLEGKSVSILGQAEVKEISVESLQHYAEDAGKSKEEIAAIKEPQRQVVLYAEGVVVK